MSETPYAIGMMRASTETPVQAFSRKIEFFFAMGAVFFAPMNILRLDAFYFTLSDAFGCLCLIAMLLNHSINQRMIGPGTAWWISGLTIMIAALLLSSLMVGVVNRGLILAAQYAFAWLLLPIILLARPWRETILLMKTFVLSMVIMAVHGVYVIDYIGDKNTAFVSGSGRLQGFMERENECGSLFALTVPMILILSEKRAINPVLGFAMVFLVAYAIMLTGSNTALYGMLFGLGVFFLAAPTEKRVFQGAIGLFLLWITLTTPGVREHLPPVFQKRVLIGLETGNFNDAGTFADRLKLIKESFRLAGDATWLGYGADQYRVISAWTTPVHNLYLLVWNEGGLAALAGFLIMLAGGAITLAAAWRNREESAAVCGVATLGLFAILINAAPHVYGRFWTTPVLLALAPAVTYLTHGPFRSRRPPPHPEP